jgi:hypothetical protein
VSVRVEQSSAIGSLAPFLSKPSFSCQHSILRVTEQQGSLVGLGLHWMLTFADGTTVRESQAQSCRVTSLLVFIVTQVVCSISNPTLLSSSQTGINLGIRSWKKRLTESAQCQEAIGGTYFRKMWRPDSQQHGSKIGKSQPWSKVGIFECMTWLNGSFFGGNDQGFVKEGVNTYTPTSSLNWPTFSFSIVASIVYDLVRVSDSLHYLWLPTVIFLVPPHV